MARCFSPIILFIIFFLIFIPAESPLKAASNIISKNNFYKVKRVVDGDTILLENGQKVRYIGINTPESVDPRRPVQCFGKEASKRNKELVEGKIVRLEKDIEDKDKYGRLLRYVFLPNGAFINYELVKQGYASVYTFPPNVKYVNKFRQAQNIAKENNLGLWSMCNKKIVSILKATSTPLVSGCVIKGNINSEGQKIYHLPNCSYYAKTVIDVARGEKWFCTETEAIKAGWRKAGNCP
jgi:micrococcal nuclease